MEQENQQQSMTAPSYGGDPKKQSGINPVKRVCRANVFPFNVQTESAQALSENSNRNYLVIQNNSGATVFVNFNAKANDAHIKIIPGGNYEPEVVPLDSVHLIASVADSSVAIVEGVNPVKN